MDVLKVAHGRQLRSTFSLSFLIMTVFLLQPCLIFSQNEPKILPDGTEGEVITAPPEDSMVDELPANEFNGSFTTLKLGMGYVVDYANFSQDDEFKQQMEIAELDLDPKVETRDFRVMASGIFKKSKRDISWKFAFLYNGDSKAWLIRETGLTIAVPELWGHFFVGRTKEGYSMAKVMNGHSILAQERQMALDVIPILADGVKWLGYLPKSRIFWNLGYYNDFISNGQSFSTYAWQISGRLGWLPMYDKEKERVLYVATSLRYGEPVNGKITLKSRPESNPLPAIINTGAFESDYSTHFGAEFYYSTGSLMIGSEVMTHNFYSNDFEDHKFFGGDLSVSYLFTGAKRPYRTVGNIFGFVPVKKSVFEGGWGEWEAVLRYSTLDLNDGSLTGGKFWRITPMVNWYMTKQVRMEFVYGYGVLDRYGIKGGINLYQIRLQLTIL